MEKIYRANAQKIIDFNMDIVARNDEEALMIFDKFVYDFDLFSSIDDYKINLSVEEKEQLTDNKNESHSDNYEIKICENCKQFCPVCHRCILDE
jgi:hypothetical protein